MNKIKIEIKNFRSISKVNMEINEKSNRIIALIGNNNAGKTKILEAIKRVGESATFTNDHKRNILKENQIEPISESPSIKIDFWLEKDDINLPIITSIENSIFHPGKLPEEKIKTINSLIDTKIKQLEKTEYKKSGAFHNGVKTFQNNYHYYAFLDAVNGLNDVEITKITKEIREWTQLLLFTEKIDITLIDNINIFKFNKLPLDLLFTEEINLNHQQSNELKAIKIWDKIMNINLKEFVTETAQKDNRNKNNKLTSFSDRANKLIKSLSEDFFDKDYKLDFKFSIFIDMEDLTLNINLESTSEKNDIGWTWDTKMTNSGDGIKKMWSMIFMLNSIDKQDPKIILLDEPEKSLNPIYQNYLIKYLNKLMSSDSEQRKNQIVIYATHSPFMTGMDMYQNIFLVDRSKKDNSTIIKPIYDTKGMDVPNVLLDKNLQLRFIESQMIINNPKYILFVEGITDFFVTKNILSDDVFIIPLFGAEYKKTASFHIPYLLSWANEENIKLLVDDDEQGGKIIEWFKANSPIPENNIKKYSDLFSKGKDLESTIINPWFEKHKYPKDDKNKKNNAIFFNSNNKDIEQYGKILNFVEKKKY